MPHALPANVAEAIGRIRGVLGDAGCLDAPGDIAPFLVDFRGLYRGATPLVACPASTADVAAVLAICNELGVGVVPHGDRFPRVCALNSALSPSEMEVRDVPLQSPQRRLLPILS